jgi:HD-GYP domain-containing protein (c-di-GMP phosphodiesterase class II)
MMGVAWWVDASRRSEEARITHRILVDVLLNALTADDAITARHSRRVADLSFALAEQSGMSLRERATLRVAALLHDMGKIDDRFFHIVHSRDPLSEAERAEMEFHPHLSARILEPLEPIHPGLTAIVASHHECWDGTGYPCGCAGEEIPLGARIVAVADVFDAMTQPRAYKEGMPVAEAFERLRQSAGRQFDPRLVDLVHAYPVREQWQEIACNGQLDEKREQAAALNAPPATHANPPKLEDGPPQA